MKIASPPVRYFLPFFILVFTLVQASAQPLIIPIETEHTAQVLRVGENQDLDIIYFGKKLSNTDEYIQIPAVYHQSDDYTNMLNAAYTSSGSRNLLEPAISVTHADGNTSLDLKYVSHESEKVDDNVSVHTILLRDPVYNFEVSLFYKTYFREDVVEQWSVIRHKEKKNVTLHKFASANIYLKADDYWLRQYHGDWAKEMQPEETQLTHGIKTLDSKLGTRAHLFQPPVFMVSLD
jgi:alpha-galactosidase